MTVAAGRRRDARPRAAAHAVERAHRTRPQDARAADRRRVGHGVRRHRRRRPLREEPHARALRRRPTSPCATRASATSPTRRARSSATTRLHVRQRDVPRRARHRPVGAQRVRLRDRRRGPDGPQQPLPQLRDDGPVLHELGRRPATTATSRSRTTSSSTRRWRTPGAWHYYSLYVGNTGPGGGALTQLGRPQQHVRDRRACVSRDRGERFALGRQPRRLELRARA